jgi:hypothetical protein
MMAYTVRKERVGSPHEPRASHFLASRAVFMKKGNLSEIRIPFDYCDGAEGGTRTPTGFPTTPSKN